MHIHMVCHILPTVGACLSVRFYISVASDFVFRSLPDQMAAATKAGKKYPAFGDAKRLRRRVPAPKEPKAMKAMKAVNHALY